MEDLGKNKIFQKKKNAFSYLVFFVLPKKRSFRRSEGFSR